MSTTTIESPKKLSKLEEILDEQGLVLAKLNNPNRLAIKQTPEQKMNETVEYVPTSGFVKIVPVKGRKMTNGQNVSASYHVRTIKDEQEGVVYGIPTGVRDGKPTYKLCSIDNERQFNLSNVADRKEFYIWLHHPNMQDGPNFKGGAKLKMVDPEQAAKEFNAKRKLARSAEDIVMGLSNAGGLTELSDFAVQFGINPKQSSDVLQQILIERTMSDPNEIVKRFNDPDRKVWTLVKKAIMFGVIEARPDGLYFGGIAMGASEINAVERIKSQPEMMVGLSDSVDQKLGAPKKLPISKRSETDIDKDKKSKKKFGEE